MTDTAPETTSALDEYTQRIAQLEQQMAAASSPEQRQIYREMIELTKNRARCFQIEERSRIKLPPDTGRWTGKPAPSSTSHEPQPERPSGWAKLDPISSPPGIHYIDQMVETDTARQRLDYLAAEHMRKQAVLDMHAEQKLFEKELASEQAEGSSFHRAPGDPDFPAQ
jgi:hypothetical protein